MSRKSLIVLIMLTSCLNKSSIQEYNINVAVNSISFSPKHDIKSFIIYKINQALESLDIINFKFDNLNIANAIIEQSRKVRVRVLLDERSFAELKNENLGFSIIDYLEYNGVNIKIFDNTPYIVHHKIILIDHKEVVSGSANFYTEDLSNNFESFISFTGEGFYSIIEDEFNRLWISPKTNQYNFFKEKIKPCLSLHKSDKTPIPNNTKKENHLELSIENVLIKNVLLSNNKKQFKPFIIKNIRAAKDSIFIQASLFTNKQIKKEVRKAAKRGVKIKILTNTYPLRDMEYIKGFNGQVKLFDTNSNGMMHNKMILIDNHIVLYGTVNIFDRSLDHDIENLIKIDDARIFNILYDEWQTIWNSKKFI